MNPEPAYDLAGYLIGLAMKVHRTLGPGYLEKIYRSALDRELRSAGISHETEVPLKVFYQDLVLGEYFADLVTAGKRIVGLKAVQTLVVEHEVQLVNYLTATEIEEGLPLNFGGPRLEFKRKFRTYRPASGKEGFGRTNSFC